MKPVANFQTGTWVYGIVKNMSKQNEAQSDIYTRDKKTTDMNAYSEKADVYYMIILILVMYWIVPIYEYLMRCEW
jgi:hypothetical protein